MGQMLTQLFIYVNTFYSLEFWEKLGMTGAGSQERSRQEDMAELDFSKSPCVGCRWVAGAGASGDQGMDVGWFSEKDKR